MTLYELVKQLPPDEQAKIVAVLQEADIILHFGHPLKVAQDHLRLARFGTSGLTYRVYSVLINLDSLPKLLNALFQETAKK